MAGVCTRKDSGGVWVLRDEHESRVVFGEKGVMKSSNDGDMMITTERHVDC